MGCYFGNRFWYRGWYCGCTVGIIFGTEGVLWESFLVQGGELWGTGGNHFLVKRGVQWVAFLVQGVVVWVYCGKQFLVLRVCTVGRIFGTGGGSVGVLWEAVFGTEVCTMGGTFDTEGICGHPCLVLWQ